MICPSCGCQQRDADYCVQCRAPLNVKGKELSPATPFPEEGFAQVREQAPVRTPRRPEHQAQAPLHILISTTQRIEGKRIRRYFGLIYANIVIESGERLSAPESNRHRNHFKDGMAKVMKLLKEEAARLGANAVVASTLQFQRIDPHTLLLSAIGTAVQLEDPS